MKHALIIGIALAAAAAIAWYFLSRSSARSGTVKPLGAFDPSALPCCEEVPAGYKGYCRQQDGSFTLSDSFTSSPAVSLPALSFNPQAGSIALQSRVGGLKPGGDAPLSTWGSDDLEWHDGSGY